MGKEWRVLETGTTRDQEGLSRGRYTTVRENRRQNGETVEERISPNLRSLEQGKHSFLSSRYKDVKLV